MTRQDQNRSYDQKKGSADLRTEGQPQGRPGHSIADGEPRTLEDVVNEVEGRTGADAQSTGSDA